MQRDPKDFEVWPSCAPSIRRFWIHYGHNRRWTSPFILRWPMCYLRLFELPSPPLPQWRSLHWQQNQIARHRSQPSYWSDLIPTDFRASYKDGHQWFGVLWCKSSRTASCLNPSVSVRRSSVASSATRKSLHFSRASPVLHYSMNVAHVHFTRES